MATYEFSRARVVVDVGGSAGYVLAGVLKQNPHLKGVLFDMPHVIAGAREVLEREGVEERCAVQAGNFFEGVPAGGDVYVLSAVLHDWDDEHCLRVLRNCRRAIPEDGALLIVERIMPERVELTDDGIETIRTDLEMLRMTGGGRERTQAEYAALLSDGGFTLTQVSPPARPNFLITAAPRPLA